MELFVGIDVAKDRLDICVRPSAETFAVTRDGEGLERLVGRLHALTPVLVVMEATGGYEAVAASALAMTELLYLALDERQQVRVDRIGVGRWHAMRKILVALERAVFQQLRR